MQTARRNYPIAGDPCAAPGTSKYRLVAVASRGYSRIMTSAARLFRIIMPVANIDEGSNFYSALLERSGFWIGFGEQVVVHDQLSYNQPDSTPKSESRPKTNMV